MLVLSALVIGMAAGPNPLPPVMGLDGRLHRPLSEAAGKPAVFVFISHDCLICNTYAPEIGRIESKYGASVQIGLVYEEPRFSRTQAAAHAKAFSVEKAELLIDPDSSFAAACRVTVTPEAAVFDGLGRPVYTGRIDDWFYGLGRQRAAPTTHDLICALDAVLTKRHPEPPAGPPVGCILVWPHKT